MCDRIDNILYDDRERTNPPLEEVLEKSCLSYKELCEYGNRKDLYAWHITDLKIYDKPKELGEFKKGYSNETKGAWAVDYSQYPVWLTRPPQLWCYVEEL